VYDTYGLAVGASCAARASCAAASTMACRIMSALLTRQPGPWLVAGWAAHAVADRSHIMPRQIRAVVAIIIAYGSDQRWLHHALLVAETNTLVCPKCDSRKLSRIERIASLFGFRGR
jgi:hypothetical protein